MDLIFNEEKLDLYFILFSFQYWRTNFDDVYSFETIISPFFFILFAIVDSTFSFNELDTSYFDVSLLDDCF